MTFIKQNLLRLSLASVLSVSCFVSAHAQEGQSIKSIKSISNTSSSLLDNTNGGTAPSPLNAINAINTINETNIYFGSDEPVDIMFDPSGNLYVRENGIGNYTKIAAKHLRWGVDGIGNKTVRSNGDGADYYYWDPNYSNVKTGTFGGWLHHSPKTKTGGASAGSPNTTEPGNVPKNKNSEAGIGAFALLGGALRLGNLLFHIGGSGSTVSSINSINPAPSGGTPPLFSGVTAPEPGTLGLLAFGALSSLIGLRRRKDKK